MRPRFRPSLESLESYALMTAVAVPVSGLSGFTLPTANVSAPVALTLTTDRTVYQVGQPVKMTLTETNTTNRVVRIADGPSVDGFFVSQDGATVWRSNAGIQPFFIRLVNLGPGQSFTLNATWDGHPNSSSGGGGELTATPTGTFVIHSQVAPFGVPANPVTITIVPAASDPPPPASQPLVVRVSTDRAAYALGRPVTVTLTETNTSNHDVRALFGARILNATVSGPRGAVWQFRDLRASLTYVGVLHAGQSRTFTILWNGAANLPGARVVPGTYTVRAGVDGVSGAANFTVL